MGVAIVAAAIRPLAHADRERVREIIVATDTFTASEVATAMELIDEWLAASEASDYLTYVLDDQDDGGVRGYVCFGPTPLTDSTYDLYWIAVDPAVQGRGYGRQLTQRAGTACQDTQHVELGHVVHALLVHLPVAHCRGPAVSKVLHGLHQ